MKTIFSESDHVAYQSKGNEMYDKMKADMLPLHTSSTPRVKSKIQNILSERGHVAYQMKGKVGHAYSAENREIAVLETFDSENTIEYKQIPNCLYLERKKLLLLHITYSKIGKIDMRLLHWVIFKSNQKIKV